MKSTHKITTISMQLQNKSWSSRVNAHGKRLAPRTNILNFSSLPQSENDCHQRPHVKSNQNEHQGIDHLHQCSEGSNNTESSTEERSLLRINPRSRISGDEGRNTSFSFSSRCRSRPWAGTLTRLRSRRTLWRRSGGLARNCFAAAAGWDGCCDSCVGRAWMACACAGAQVVGVLLMISPGAGEGASGKSEDREGWEGEVHFRCRLGRGEVCLYENHVVGREDKYRPRYW